MLKQKLFPASRRDFFFLPNLSSQIRKYYWSTTDSKQKILWMNIFWYSWAADGKLRRKISNQSWSSEPHRMWKIDERESRACRCVGARARFSSIFMNEFPRQRRRFSLSSPISMTSFNDVISFWHAILEAYTKERTVACVLPQLSSARLSVLVLTFEYFIRGERYFIMHFKYIVFFILIFNVNGQPRQHDSQHMFLKCNLISEFINYKVMITRYLHCCCHKLLRDIKFSRKISYYSRKIVIKSNTFRLPIAAALFDAGSGISCWFEARWLSFWCCPEES